MTCGSKKHIAEALSKIHVHEIEKPPAEPKTVKKRVKLIVQS